MEPIKQFVPGRTRVLTEAQALVILKCRERAGATRLHEFMREELREGNIPREVSSGTLYSLFSGRMYPGLIDPETGVTYDYSKLPRLPAGRPKRFVDGVEPGTLERKRGIPPLRQWLLDKTLDEMRIVLDARARHHYSVFLHQEGIERDKDRGRVAQLEARVAQLELQVGGAK